MAVTYTEEAKYPLQDDGGANWGAIVNGVLEALDAGAELTFTAGEDIAAGDCVALSRDGCIYRSASNSSTLTPAIGFAPYAITSGNAGKVRWFGWIDVDTSFSVGDSVSWAAGECAYVGSVAGRLAKTQYSWANAVGYAKSDTDASWVTRFTIDPKTRCTQLIRDLIVQECAMFRMEIDNGESGAAVTIHWDNGNKQRIELTNNCIISFAAPIGNAANLILKVEQDGSGGHTVTWPGSLQWPNSSIPALSTGAGDVHIVALYYDGQNYYGTVARNMG